MSLSFVSSAVQTVTTDGGYEETKIESKEIDEVNRRNAHKPLFEQLRANQEEDQARQEELQREMMRGTRTLDEDDVAHLDSITMQRAERERAIQEQTQSELAQFRAARALRRQAALSGNNDEVDDDDDDGENNETGPSIYDSAHVPMDQNRFDRSISGTTPSAPRGPLIKVKKRKRRTTSDEEGTAATEMQHAIENTSELVDQSDKSKSDKVPPPSSAVGGLSDLLCGYGSSDDSE